MGMLDVKWSAECKRSACVLLKGGVLRDVVACDIARMPSRPLRFRAAARRLLLLLCV